MDKHQATELIKEALTERFDKQTFYRLIKELLNHIDESKANRWNQVYVKDAFKPGISHYERLGTYIAPNGDKLDVLIVNLKRESSLERARTFQRNFVADYLAGRDQKEAALVAFVSPDQDDWRFSFIKMEYALDEKGKIYGQLTPARRYSFLVGSNENSHTAQKQLVPLLQESDKNISLAEIEQAFSVEKVTDEFFEQYRNLFFDLKEELELLIAKDRCLQADFTEKQIDPIDFAKKLLGQIIFLYFLQKKGWLGVKEGNDWGTGPQNFLRQLYDGEYTAYENFFNDVLEPLFYDTLATDRGFDSFCSIFKCRIPFLDGGLFEPLKNYDWQKTAILLSNAFFSNFDETAEGDKGTGILDVFERYNFTVNEAEPLEKEVAIDPEMLGKVFERLLEVKERKSKGSFYTPREIVHYMCQESLISYLSLELETVPTEDIETFIRNGEQYTHYEDAKRTNTKGEHYPKPPASIRSNAHLIDEKLQNITVCDPAIGSGAFPVGMMNEIVKCRYSLTPYFSDYRERTTYFLKRHAIQNCLYGVDIDSGAVEIAKLRLWLSLVVDEDDVKQIKPLPNLDYKIVRGDSLLQYPFETRGMKQIEDLKQQFFNETRHQEKEELKNEIERAIQTLFINTPKTLGYMVDFDFKVYFSDVFQKNGGFDVVIGNPPYINMIQLDKNKGLRDTLRALYKTATGAFDYFVPFYELGYQIAKPKGTMSLITPNKILSIDFATDLRKFLRNRTRIVHLLDASHCSVFDAAVYPVSILFTKSNPNCSLPIQLYRAVRQSNEIAISRIGEVGGELISEMPGEIWAPLLEPGFELLRDVIKSPQRLTAEVCKMRQAATVDEAYKMFRPLIKEEGDVVDGNVAKHFVVSGTIDRYKVLWGTKKTQYLKTSFQRPVLLVDAEILSKERYHQVNCQKIILSGQARFPEAYFDETAAYAAGIPAVFIYDSIIPLDFLCGVLNSSLYREIYRILWSALAMSGNYMRFGPPQLQRLPYPRATKEQVETIGKWVRKVQEEWRKNKPNVIAVRECEEKIDRLVLQMFSISVEDFIRAFPEPITDESQLKRTLGTTILANLE